MQQRNVSPAGWFVEPKFPGLRTDECTKVFSIEFCKKEDAYEAIKSCSSASPLCERNPDLCFSLTPTQFYCYPNGRDCSKPHPGDCSWYTQCLERKYQCGIHGPNLHPLGSGHPRAFRWLKLNILSILNIIIGYPLGFVGIYCRKFTEACTTRMTEFGLKWCMNTRQCLIDRAFDLLYQTKEKLTCDDVHRIGFDTHPECYTQQGSSFCDLPLSDIQVVLQVAAVRHRPRDSGS